MNQIINALTYSCSSGLYLLCCPWSCDGVANNREGVGGLWYQSCDCDRGCGCVAGVRRSIGGVCHLIHGDDLIGDMGKLPFECDGCEGTAGGQKRS